MSSYVPFGCRWAVPFSLFWLLWGGSLPLEAGECDPEVARAISIQGLVEAIAADESEWSVVQQGDRFCPGDRLRVGANSRAGLTLSDESLMRLAENSSVRFSAPAEDGGTWLELLEGIAHFISRVTRPFRVDTPYVNASIEGTEFTVEAGPENAGITVLEGRVLARNRDGEIVVNGGQRAGAPRGQPPRAEAVDDPLAAVQWALYYPPLLEPADDSASEAVLRSVKAYRRGDLSGAFAALAEEPDVDKSADLLVYRASLHLQVGGIDAAREDLRAALRLEPQQADALALMSLIATVRNEPQPALELAQRAVEVAGNWTCNCQVGESNNRAGTANLALSYARQARFQLPEALAASRQATRAAPENPLAWSRLAQMELMFRHLDASAEAARRAVEIAPEQPQSRTTLGFARLTRLDLDGARQAFEAAIRLDQAAPLPRLGLGLVQIREGDLAGGRRQLETAANLDPGNALIRSYLGKAYYEEKRDAKAATQFTLGKQFDEFDPTAWFYDAILKQADNRPVEALREMQTAIDLNGNRAVYRSRLLLDQDEAARNASQARIYQDLGFEQLAQLEAYKSLQTSPQTHSAHRLLSDSYTGQPRYEKARMSELLQSQLLQPLNTTPIQPQLAVSSLGILDGAGPSAGGFSEYNPLFTRNGPALQFNAVGGSNDTFGDDLIFSGLKDRISFSLGQFHYETDGWRENNDLTQNIRDAFLQASLSPSTNVQFEYRHQEAESGDLAFNFDAAPNPIERNHLKRKVGRIGLHHQFTPSSHLLASAIYQDLRQTRKEIASDVMLADFPPFGILPATVDTTDILTYDSIARTVELQLIQHLFGHTFILGGGNYDESSSEDWFNQQTLTVPLPVAPYIYTLTSDPAFYTYDFDPQFKNLYLYSLLALPARLSMTLGVVYEDFKSAIAATDQVSPKFGLTWEARKNLTFRAAYLKAIAHPSYMEQTIEQTQVEGFNQVFDDISGSKIEQFGLGMDARVNRTLNVGAEFTRRDLQSPGLVVTEGKAVYEGSDEKHSRAYLYWTATDRLGISIAYEKELFERAQLTPENLTTQRTPIGFSYHWPSGIFFQSEGTFINQEITRLGTTEREDFWNVDAVLGYRFPKRYGKAELIVKNILDEEFYYYDLSFLSGEPLMPQFQPKRQLFARFTLNF